MFRDVLLLSILGSALQNGEALQPAATKEALAAKDWTPNENGGATPHTEELHISVGTEGVSATKAQGSTWLADEFYFAISHMGRRQLWINDTESCPWMTSTSEDWVLECNDGTFCDIQYASGAWGCCTTHGGRKRCPKLQGYMCAGLFCSGYTENCCQANAAYCDKKNLGGLRPCYPSCTDLEVMEEEAGTVSLWSDVEGENCNDYYVHQYCTEAGDYGDSSRALLKWADANFSDYANYGLSAADACCSCGGGLNDPPPPQCPPSQPPPEPPHPPSPPPLPNAPAVTLEGTSAILNNSQYASPQLVDALQTTEVAAIVLYTDVALDEALPVVNRTISVTGLCGDLQDLHCEVSGRNRHRIFSVARSGAVSLHQVALRHGFADANSHLGNAGGALYLEAGGILTGYNCIFEANEAYDGAAIFAVGCSVTLSWCSVTGNTAGHTVLHFVDSTVIVDTQSRVAENFADKACCLFTRNSSVLVQDSQVEDNYSLRSVGGIALEGSNGVIRASNLTGNSGWYGALHLSEFSSMLLCEETSISQNEGRYRTGGMYMTSGSKARIIESTTVTNNTAVFSGAGLALAGTGSPIEGATVCHNVATTDSGGGISVVTTWLPQPVTLDRTLVCGNTAEGMFGGGMYVAASAVLISSEVLNNSAAYGGGLAGGSYLLQEGSLVSSNKASKQGGGIWSDNYLEVTNCSMLSQNSAGEEGGGVFLDSGSALTLSSDSAVEDNEGGSGGGIQCGTHATITMDAASVVRNRAASNGGGIVASEGCTLTLDNGSMVWNNAALKGGGIFANKASAVDVLSNSS
ncbi:hypothetical protein CYMTET_20360, partial [Cymbomonas tetramitiformis]